jgi:hypothetical protein
MEGSENGERRIRAGFPGRGRSVFLFFGWLLIVLIAAMGLLGFGLPQAKFPGRIRKW